MTRIIAIREKDLIRRITAEQSRREDQTTTKTAAKLLWERLRELEIERRQDVEAPVPGTASVRGPTDSDRAISDDDTALDREPDDMQPTGGASQPNGIAV